MRIKVCLPTFEQRKQVIFKFTEGIVAHQFQPAFRGVSSQKTDAQLQGLERELEFKVKCATQVQLKLS
jgi:hypothetical protein